MLAEDREMPFLLDHIARDGDEGLPSVRSTPTPTIMRSNAASSPNSGR